MPNNQQDWKSLPVININPTPNFTPPSSDLPVTSPQTNKEIYSPPGGAQGSTRDIFIDAIRPVLAGIAGGAAGSLGMAGGPALAAGGATGAYLTVNHLMNMMRSQPQQDELGDAATNVALQEVGGKFVMDPLMQYAANLAGGVTNSIKELAPTYSQYRKAIFGDKAGNISKWIEDVWGRGTKKAAIENSAKLGSGIAQQQIAKASGRTLTTAANPEYLASNIQVNAENQLSNLYRAADSEANKAKLYSHANTQTIQAPPDVDPFINQLSRQQANKPFSSLDSTEKQTILKLADQLGWQPKSQQIAGPINLTKSIQVAKDYLEGKAGSVGPLVPPDPDNPMTKAAQNLLNISQAQFAPDGRLASAVPISFDDAWDWKKLANDFGWGEKSRGTPVQAQYIDSRFKEFSRAIDSDISDSMSQWQNGGDQAKQAWRNSSAIVNMRHSLYSEDGLRQLIDNNNDNMPIVDSILNDSKKLQRAFNSGQLNLPGGTVASTNMRNDLRAYAMQKFMRDSTTFDDMTGQPRINAAKIFNDFYDPKWQEQRKMLFNNATGDRFIQLMKNLSITQQPQENTLSRFVNPKVWTTMAGMHIAGNILEGHLTGLGGPFGLGASSFILANSTLGRIMSNPKWAEQLIKLSGTVPLGQSEQAVGRAFINAINGYRIGINSKDGNTTWGTVNDGKFEPEWMQLPETRQ